MGEEKEKKKKKWTTHHLSCIHDIHKEVECPKVSLGQLSPASLRDPAQAYVREGVVQQRESKKIKERKSGPGVKLESKGKIIQ